MKLIGYAFLTGRIDFMREENPWAFTRIDQGMKQSQADRIRVDPSQALIELRSADVNGKEVPEWMDAMERTLRSAESIYLQYKSGVLRFRRANHPAGNHKTFVTLGNQEEVNLFAEENWKRIRYFYAKRRLAFTFDVNTMITHKSSVTDTKKIELPAKLDMTHPSGRPQLAFDATGSNASVDIIEWRSSVREGEQKRYQPEGKHIEMTCRNVTRPFTFLHENRVEFKNHSYTFSGEKMEKLFERTIKKRLAQIETEFAEEQT
ncbi:MAG: hypothetical protein AAF623_12400 [Planctomycetota bacterium]